MQGPNGQIPAVLAVRGSGRRCEWLPIVTQNVPMACPPRVRGHSTPIAKTAGGAFVQHVLCSPARIPAADPPRSGLCAAPASIKRCTLSYTISTTTIQCGEMRWRSFEVVWADNRRRMTATGGQRRFAHRRLRVARQPIVNSLYSPTLLSTAMVPRCAFVTPS